MADQTNAEVSDERLRDDSADEVGWLIERNDLEVKPLWYWEDPYKPGWHSWTRTAADAKRFPTRAEAEAFEPYRLIATDKAISLTEHVFIGTAIARNSALNRRSVTSQASEGEVVGWIDPAQLAEHARADAALTNVSLLTKEFAEATCPTAVPTYASPSKRVERLEALKECAKIAHTAHLQCVDERDRIRQNTPEFGYAQAKVEAVTAVWHLINELLPKEPSSGQALQGGRS